MKSNNNGEDITPEYQWQGPYIISGRSVSEFENNLDWHSKQAMINDLIIAPDGTGEEMIVTRIEGDKIFGIVINEYNEVE